LTNTQPSETNITLDQTKSEATKKTLQTGLNYDKAFGAHNISGVLLIEQSDYRWDKIGAYREGFISDAIDQIFAGSDINKNNLGEAREEARRGYIGRVAYNYNNKYLVQANARYDGSYNFPSDSRFAMFPAFSAGWRISEEEFMPEIPYLNNLKLRASWGQFGNDRINIDDNDVYFPYYSGYEYNEGAIVGGKFYGGVRPTGLANSNITWETAVSSNVGLEFGFFEGKLSGEFDYFQKSTKDILMNQDAAVPATFGAELPAENLGEVDNWGYEGALNYKNNFGDYFVSVGGNITYATSKVKYIAEALDVPSRIRKTGQPFDVRIGYVSEGLFQTQEEIDAWAVQDNNGNKSLQPGDIKYKDINGDTLINDEDRIIFGQSSTPKLVFGLNFNVEYKGFALAANFHGAAAYDNYKMVESFQKEYNSLEVLADNSWREGNEDARYPRLEIGRSNNNSSYSSYWMYDGFYIKLRNLDVSYTLADNSYLDRVGIDNVVLSLSGRNILTLAGNKDFDPENPNMNYPIMKTYTFGVSITY
jgi:TonB-linked SusC/RagA family outer membrane protein